MDGTHWENLMTFCLRVPVEDDMQGQWRQVKKKGQIGRKGNKQQALKLAGKEEGLGPGTQSFPHSHCALKGQAASRIPGSTHL